MERIQHAPEVTLLQRPGGAALVLHEAHDSRSNGEGVRQRTRPPSVKIARSLLDDTPIVMPNEAGPAAHAYRMLRTQLLQRIRQHRVKTLGIVSAADGEGKTLTAINLALSLAVEPNQTVLLADLDLRRPSIASALKLRVEYGLESWFAGEIAEIQEITYPVEGFQRLSILPTLAAVTGSSEALASMRAQTMLKELRTCEVERLVLIDLPPLLLTDEFLTVAPHLDGVVIVAREGRTKRDDLTRMSEILGSFKVFGTVLNHSTQFERRAY